MYAPICIAHCFFGNMVNPKTIILGNNPSYSQIFEDLEYLEYRDEILGKYINYSKTEFLDYTNREFDIREKYNDLPKPRGSRGNRSTYEWWTNNVFNEENKEKFKIETTAVFNIVGYHSHSYSSIKEEALIDKKDELKEVLLKDSSLDKEAISKLLDDNYNYRFLPTSNAIARYIKGLLEKGSIEIYTLWKDYKDWYKLFTELKKYKINDGTDNYIMKSKKKDE